VNKNEGGAKGAEMALLTVNVGSSSVRLGWHAQRPEHRAIEMRYDALHDPKDIERVLGAFLANKEAVTVVCHRIVHAGFQPEEICLFDEGVEAATEAHAMLAPNHNPATLNWIATCCKMLGTDTVQVAAFDTGLYADLPEVAAGYAVPPSLGVRRLGFHGLAHKSMLLQAKQALGQSFQANRVLSLQLGSGCSITASIDLQPMDTSMGFTPLEGLMMSTRCGDVDPGVPLYLVQHSGMAIEEVESLLSKQSGLQGVSGQTGDVEALLSLDNDQAELAVNMFCYRIKKYIGAFAAALGGIDVILIGGGVGEHAPIIREKFLSGLEFLGIAIDRSRNDSVVGRIGKISSDESNVKILVVPPKENTLMAEQAFRFLSPQG